MGYRIARWVILLIVRLVARLDVYGMERIPTSGGFVVATNHIGRLDPLLAYYFLDREDIIMLVAEKYQKIGLARWFVRQLDGIWVDRFNADFGAVREALKRLRKGGALVIAPEGTRSPTGALIEGQPGLAYLAAKSSMPIYPVVLTGSRDKEAYALLRRLRRVQVRVQVGEPFTLPPLKGKQRVETLAQYTDEIMCRIAALLPPDYRGVYTDHPRLHELLRE